MMKKKIPLCFFLSALVFLCLFSSANATRSRLSGMGGLSVVIEDESNMINLWDFAGNPAGLLFDEETSTISSYFLYRDYEIEEIPFFTHSTSNPYATSFTFKAAGSLLHTVNWLSFRKSGDFAVGLGGSYLERDTDAHYDDHKLTYPDVHLTFCKSIRPSMSVGIDVAYLDYDFQLERAIYPDVSYDFVKMSDEKISGYRTEVGVRSQNLSKQAVLGVSVGYEQVDVSWGYLAWWYEYYLNPDAIWPLEGEICRTTWLSLQVILNGHQRLKFGADMRLHFQNEDIAADRYQKGFSFKLRTAYEVSPAFRLALFFWSGDSFAEYFDPVYSYFSSLRTSDPAMELGVGISWRLHRRILVGLEYHFSDYPQPVYYTNPWNLETHSVNAGLEIELFDGFFTRGGYVGSSLNHGPSYWREQGSWLNGFAWGLGFQPQDPDLVIELAYRYFAGNYRNWYGQWDVKSDTRSLSVSVKKLL